MHTITWKHQCYICQRPIHRGKPTILFSTDKPMLVGICHSTCGNRYHKLEQFQMCPPGQLSEKQISFLVQFFFKLYSLPGGQKPKRELRWCLTLLLQDFPASLDNPLASLRKFLDEHKLWSHEWLYDGDLEADFLRVLGQIQKAATENPTGLEIDFRA